MGKTKIILVSFLKPRPLSFEFSKWPNHITIVPFFNTSDIETFINEVSHICENLHKITYKVGSVDFFGPKKNVKVNLVNKSDELQNLHSLLLDIVLKHDKNMKISDCGFSYKPHITHNGVPYPKESDEGTISEIYIVEYLSLGTDTTHTKIKKVTRIINLE